MPEPKTEADLRAFRQRTAAEPQKPAGRRAKDPCGGGLVRALESLGAILIVLGLTGLLVGVLTTAAHLYYGREGVDVYVGLSSSIFTALAGVVFLWMGEVLYLLRRIDERARGEP